MLNIFSKKTFLKDFLENFVDIHCHILPGIDDGSKSLNESLELINGMRELGISQYVATPHIMQDFYPNDEISIGNAFQNLITELTNKKLNEVIVNPSAEYMMDSHFESLVEEKKLFPLKENYVLVEMSYFQAPINLKEIIDAILKKEYIPVLAHPERYSFYHNKKEYYKTLKQMGCLFQLNMLSLSDHYGKNIQKAGQFLLEENLIDFLASDIHNKHNVIKLGNLALTKNQAAFLPKIIENTRDTFLIS